MTSTSVRRVRMTPLVATLWLLATPVLGQGPESLTRAARSVNWTSASALNAVLKDTASVKRFLNEIASDGDTSAAELVPEVYSTGSWIWMATAGSNSSL